MCTNIPYKILALTVVCDYGMTWLLRRADRRGVDAGLLVSVRSMGWSCRPGLLYVCSLVSILGVDDFLCSGVGMLSSEHCGSVGVSGTDGGLETLAGRL